MNNSLASSNYTEGYIEAYQILDEDLDFFREIARPKFYTPKEYAFSVKNPVFKPAVYQFVKIFYGIRYGSIEATESNVKSDKTLNGKIFSNPSVVDHSLDDDPYIHYTANDTIIYYIEIVLVGGGPDTFTLSSNLDLTRYYLPIIPGYQIGFLILSLIITSSLIIFFKKRITKKN